MAYATMSVDQNPVGSSGILLSQRSSLGLDKTESMSSNGRGEGLAALARRE